ncbi:nuclear transport factor 2 family protein [Paraglaciecola sp.]|uniref:nuclear transport factor 2 family protein n=1 Tax=Paraglaciecola sp. TaxID=1920173 RepID=UPI0030F37115
MNSTHTIEQVMVVLESYFDGLYHADSNILAPLFHSDARYVNTVAGDYMNYSMSEYLSTVKERKSPASLAQSRCDNVISIEIDGESMCFAKLSMMMLGREYLDYLTLIFSDGRWQIVSKVFSYKAIKGGL